MHLKFYGKYKWLLSLFFFKLFYLFEWPRDRDKAREIAYLLVYSPKCPQQLGWAKTKQGILNSTQIHHT